MLYSLANNVGEFAVNKKTPIRVGEKMVDSPSFFGEWVYFDKKIRCINNLLQIRQIRRVFIKHQKYR
ncbi:hypothetical protein AQUCO_02500364v1 [Aquilegia coerulea]|uniref:Uncharacterized protein n=1 Tax=Aquilegia coerulea TaxID=218851 RepID=A0A2G5DAV9_AQUCA|nr:hypothetical protein AQUCO_02500364v1 [Aquilegia coerulea]